METAARHPYTPGERDENNDGVTEALRRGRVYGAGSLLSQLVAQMQSYEMRRKEGRRRKGKENM